MCNIFLFVILLEAANLGASVGTTGDSYDNALAETVNGLYKTEVIDYWKADVQLATLNWVIENKRIPIPEHVQPEPEKRGFGSRFFKPYEPVNYFVLVQTWSYILLEKEKVTRTFSLFQHLISKPSDEKHCFVKRLFDVHTTTWPSCVRSFFNGSAQYVWQSDFTTTWIFKLSKW